MQALLNVARTSPLCRRQLHLQESQSCDENDEGLWVGRPVAPRPSGKLVGLDLTRFDAENFAGARLES